MGGHHASDSKEACRPVSRLVGGEPGNEAREVQRSIIPCNTHTKLPVNVDCRRLLLLHVSFLVRTLAQALAMSVTAS